MTRGYLKHQDREVGSKAGRGGSSAHSQQRNKIGDDDQQNPSRRSRGGGGSKGAAGRFVLSLTDDDYTCYTDEYDYGYDYINEDDYEWDGIEQHARSIATGIDEQECPICCEVRPLVPLLRKCKHPPACRVCLREMYVNQAQEDVSKYPLRCFHPSCRRPVHATQLIRHNLVRSEKELQKHYRFEVLQRASQMSKSERVNIVHCPDCDCPQPAKISKTSARCKQCKTHFVVAHDGVTNIMTTIAVVEGMGGDKIGINDGWAKCPRCKIIISKGDGCDHMRCVCGHNFSWSSAMRNKVRSAKPKMAFSKHL